MLNRDEIQLGDVVFNISALQLTRTSGEHIQLRNKSSEVLACLAKHPDSIVSKSSILDEVWTDVTVSEDSLTQCIADIRRAIGDTNQQFVRTHVGKGYSLNTQNVRQPISFKLPAIVALSFAVAGAVIWWFSSRPAEPVESPRVAILAFDDLSAGEDKGWLSDGIAEGVITELARYREFRVIARNSSFSFRNAPMDVTEIAQRLDADYLVEGSKQKSGNRLRVTVQLIDGHDGTHIWAHEFDANIGELFDVQSEIVRSISLGIGSELAWVPPRSGGRKAVDALHFFHKGNEAFSKGTPESYNQAAEFYSLSISADPEAPFGYVGMATLVWGDVSQGWYFVDMSRDEILRRGFDYAEKAVAADPNYYLSHVARGDLHTSAGEFEEALVDYEKAAELNPASSVALAVAAEPLLYLNRADDAIAMIEQALDINPISEDWYYNILSRSLWWAYRCEEGLAAIKKRTKVRPWDYRAMIMNLVCLDRVEEAREAGKKIMELDPSFTVSAHARRMEATLHHFPEYVDRWTSSLRKAGLPEN